MVEHPTKYIYDTYTKMDAMMGHDIDYDTFNTWLEEDANRHLTMTNYGIPTKVKYIVPTITNTEVPTKIKYGAPNMTKTGVTKLDKSREAPSRSRRGH
jgi:predicted GTPase